MAQMSKEEYKNFCELKNEHKKMMRDFRKGKISLEEKNLNCDVELEMLRIMEDEYANH